MTNQRVDEWGRVVLNEEGLVELLFKGIEPSEDLLAENTPEMAVYNQWCKTFDATDRAISLYEPLQTPPDEFHYQRQKEWLIPDEFKNLDVEEFLLAKCSTPDQTSRVLEELTLFKKHDMLDVLRLFVYITSTLTKNNVWWGVGRGSSVSSYCLFLIGVHRVDSLAYGLDIKEFIRDH